MGRSLEVYPLTANHSDKAFCVYCREKIPHDQPALRLQTAYGYHSCTSTFLHLKCVEGFTRKLRKSREFHIPRFVATKLRGK